MKKIAFILCTFLSAGMLHAQEFRLGFKAGVNFVDIDPENFDGNTAYETIESDEKGLGYHAGGFGRASFGGFMIQTELLFTHLDQTLTAKGSGQESDEMEVDFNRFDIPLLMGAKLGPVHVLAGPVASLNLPGADDFFDNSLADATYGYQLALGVDLGKITIGAKYEGPFSETARRIQIDEMSFKTDTRVHQFIGSLYIDLL